MASKVTAQNSQLTRIARAIERMDKNQARESEANSLRAIGNAILVALVIGQFVSDSIDVSTAIYGLLGFVVIYLIASWLSKGGDPR
jgi:Na+/H+ antiporter NhaD/arsenite permease-like protein